MIKAVLYSSFCLILTSGCAQESQDSSGEVVWKLTRSDSNPLISTESDGVEAEWGFKNINGPSIIRVPEWIDSPLGKYYLYFAHHRGSYIRMAYSDVLEGPWTIYDGGVLDLANTPALDHIASPDVLVDGKAQIIRMYFHSVDDTSTWKQTTYQAKSPDGLQFLSDDSPLAPPYLRVFQVDQKWWGVAKLRGGPGGVLLRATGPDGPFEEGPQFLPGMRHGTVLVQGNRIEVIFSRIGDEPERLLKTSFDPVVMWNEPFEPKISDLLKPERDYEGAELSISVSAVGESVEPVNALRDPYIFVDSTGEMTLFYSIAGENGIAMARIHSETSGN